MSSEPVGNRAITHFDVLVIGSGAGGGAITEMLATHGQKVLVLEAGSNWYEGLDNPDNPPISRDSNDELKHGTRHFIAKDPLVEPRTFRHSEADGDRTFVGPVNALAKQVGGAWVHADMKVPRFQPQDFELGTRLGDVSGASFADWPIGYDQLEPFYDYTEKLMGVQGKRGTDPFEGPRRQEFPMPPGVPMYVARRIADGARSIGLHPFPFPTAVNSRPYDGRPPCVDCGFCSGFGCPSNAKGSPPVTTLRRALLTRNVLLLPETRAVRLVVNGAGDTVTGVEAIQPDGSRHTFVADRYVLASSPIEDARLLLMSDPGGPGIGNASGLVGRNLLFHFQTIAIGIFEERVHGYRGRAVTHGFSDFRGVAGDSSKPLGGIVEISGGSGPLYEASFYQQIFAVLGFDGARFKSLMRQSPGRDRVVALVMQAEDAPQPTNRVDLDPAVRDLDGLPVARVTYKNHNFELSARDFYSPKLLDVLQAAGAKYAVVLPADDISASAHIMGTLRFGTNPATSVCDPNGRFHKVGNLYAADGSLFPTASGFNPTLTLASVAARVGAAMVSPGSPESALTPP